VRETAEETGVTVEVTGLLGIYSDPGHIVACTDGEVRQEYEVILIGRPVSGNPAANDEASAAGWFASDNLDGLDIDPTQWRQLRDWLDRTYPRIEASRQRSNGPVAIVSCGSGAAVPPLSLPFSKKG
jgi:8-oxo-dGTP pyrophosphatase MutT (NUDIX family)